MKRRMMHFLQGSTGSTSQGVGVDAVLYDEGDARFVMVVLNGEAGQMWSTGTREDEDQRLNWDDCLL